MKLDSMKIARIYLRVSTDEQDLTRQADIEQSTSIHHEKEVWAFLANRAGQRVWKRAWLSLENNEPSIRKGSRYG